MEKWEYKVKHLHIERDGLIGIEAKLNEWGLDGWELVAVVAVAMTGDADAYLKRPRPAQEAD